MSTESKHSQTVTLTEENFQAYSRAEKPLLVDFWADWCPPCRTMEPVIEKLASRYDGRMVFGKVNVDEQMNISSRYQVFSIPTFMLFRNGQPMDAVIGAVAEASLDQMIRRALGGRSA